MPTHVSIIIPVHNTKSVFLNQCLKSILYQSCSQPLEIVIFDDGSSLDYKLHLKRTVERLSELISVVFGETEVQRGPSPARNSAVDLANGEYLLFLDSDDVLHSNAVERCLKTLSDKLDLIYTNCMTMSEDMKQIVHKRDKRIYHELMLQFKGTRFDPLLHSTFVLHARMMKRATFLELGGFREDVYGGAGNIDLNMRLSELSPGSNFALVPEFLYFYRTNPHGVTHTPHLRKRVVADMERVIVEAAQRLGHDITRAKRLCRATPTHASHYLLFEDGVRIEAPYFNYEQCSIKPNWI